ncbi:serine/threonine protein kinase [Caldimonas tepidiphila]|uniref:serine/threonine protein kinase n=1 Tax=Caldimonas tepidiphila TaxID=2315841 RepID=UPI0014742DF9|nr:serine/threonine protein kinase [Caldimonas tepidiphila]
MLQQPAEVRTLGPGLRLGEYEIERVLCEGSDSIVYLAHDHGLQRRVALREYLPAGLAGRGTGGETGLLDARHADLFALGLRAFAHEARLLARCDHPALVKVLRYWEARHTGYMAMQWLDGESLQASREAMAQPPGESWLRSVMLDLAGALETLHGAFAQHRNVHPGNILLQADGRPVLLGFHAARRVLAEHGAAAADGLAGQAYAPLEAQPEGLHLQQGPWSDLYSLAAVAYFCLTGEVPPSPAERLAAGVARPLGAAVRSLYQRHPGLQYSAGFISALDWAFELQPQDRPRNAAEWRAVLLQLQPGSHAPNTAASPAPARAAPQRQAPDESSRPAPGFPGLPARVGAALPLHFPEGAGAAAMRMPRPPQQPDAPESSAARRPEAGAERSGPPITGAAAPGGNGAVASPEIRAGLTAAREPGWDGTPPSTSAPAGAPEPSEEAVRAALAAALDSLPQQPPRRDSSGMRPGPGPRAPAAAERLPRRWLWPAAGVLVAMAIAAGWQWKQQREAQDLSRAMAGSPAPAGEGSADLPRGERDANGATAELPVPGRDAAVADIPPAPPPSADAQGVATAENPGRSQEGSVPDPVLAAPGPQPPVAAARTEAPVSSAAVRAEAREMREAAPAAASPVTREQRRSPDPEPRRTAEAKSAPRPAAKPAEPAPVQFRSPRAACAPRERFSLYYCMQQQCAKPQFRSHRQCVALRERDEIE